MFRLFSRQSAPLGSPNAVGLSEEWSLPDMECVQDSDVEPAHRATSFQYEDSEIHPAGVFTAELIGWRALDGCRALWRFRAIPASDFEAWKPEPLPFVTGTTCRPDNHLGQVLVALGVVPGVQGAEDLDRPEIRAQMRAALETLDPDDLLGRPCRIQVEHVRDDLGDLSPRIRRLTPPGWM